jgi:hypothetical protein
MCPHNTVKDMCPTAKYMCPHTTRYTCVLILHAICVLPTVGT